MNAKRFSRVLASMLCQFAVCVLAISAAHSQSTTSGLNLHLEMSLVENTTDSIHTRLALKNESANPITLAANWPYEHDSGSFADYFEATVSFSTEPPTYITTGQTAGAMRQSAQPQHVLNPGGAITVEWTENCGRIKPIDTTICTAPRLQEPGRYTIRACFHLGPGNEILESNPISIDFGRSSDPPACTSAKVLEIDAATSTALLDAGSNHGLKPGQQFVMCMSTVTGFIFTVSSVESTVSRARVEPIAPPSWNAQPPAAAIGQYAWRKDTMESVTCARESVAPASQAPAAALYLVGATFLLFILLIVMKLQKYTRSTPAERLP